MYSSLIMSYVALVEMLATQDVKGFQFAEETAEQNRIHVKDLTSHILV